MIVGGHNKVAILSPIMKTNTPNEFALACDSSFNTIGYKVTLTADRELVIKLANIGLEKVVGAKPSSTADQALGYNRELKKDVKRPDGWKRDQIQYTEANASGLRDLFVAYLRETYGVEANVEVFQAQKQDAFKEARTVLANMITTFTNMQQPELLTTWAVKTIGYTGDGALDSENLELLAAIAANNAKIATPAKK